MQSAIHFPAKAVNTQPNRTKSMHSIDTAVLKDSHQNCVKVNRATSKTTPNQVEAVQMNAALFIMADVSNTS